MKLERLAVSEGLRRFVAAGSGVLVGPPGVGKTFLLKEYCEHLLDAGVPCLYLPLDKLGANSESDLRVELGISTDLATYLTAQDRPSSHPPVLVIDAFDAARSELAQQFVVGLIRRVKEVVGKHWRILISVRSYDAKKSLALQSLFPDTAPPAVSEFRDAEIRCRHFCIRPLSMQEVQQVIETIPELPSLYAVATPEFRDLMRIPFNLWLVESLLVKAAARAQLSTVSSEIQLLNLFWNHRVVAAPNATDLAVLLTRVTAHMVERRTLAVRVADVYPIGAGPVWDALLSAEILEQVEPNKQRVIFSHNILFDYAVSVLLIDDDPALACAFLADDPSRPLFLRPSVDYFFTRLWDAAPQKFWNVLWYMLEAPEDHVRVYARLVPAMVMAREGRDVEQFAPLLERVAAGHQVGAAALLHLLQAVRGLFRGQRDGLWAELARRAAASLKSDFARELAALTLDILERAIALDDVPTIAACAEGGRRILAWAWAERSRETTPFIDNVGAVWGVRLVARTFRDDPRTSRALLEPILARLADPSFPIVYFSHLTDELSHIWASDPDFAVDVYQAAFTHEERSEEKTSFGTPILPLTSTRRQDFSMCQYHLTQHYDEFLQASPLPAVCAGIRAVNEFVIDKHVLRFLNPGFALADVTETFEFRGHQATYVRDLSYSWDASLHRDEPIQLADQLFGRMEGAAKSSEFDVIDEMLEVFADEARVAFFWKRLLETASRFPSVFAPRLFELAVAEPVLENSETLHAVGMFLQECSSEFTEEQRREIETRILQLPEKADGEKAREVRTRWRDRLIARFPRDVLTTDEGKHLRADLESRGSLPQNEPLVRFSSGSEAYSAEKWLRDEGADPARVENRSLLDATEPLDKFTSEWRNQRPSLEAVATVLQTLRAGFRVVQEGTAADKAARDLAWTRVASAAETVARGVATPEDEAFDLSREILLAALAVDPPNEEPDRDESYTFPSWSPMPVTEAAQGLPWLARLRADAELIAAIEELARDPRPAVRFLVVRKSFRFIETAPAVFWRIAEERATNDRNVVVQDALCRALGDVLGAERSRAVSALAVLAERVLVQDADSEVLKTLTALATWLAFAHENTWAIEFSNRLLERPSRFSHALAHAVFEAVNYLRPGDIGSERDLLLNRATEWLSKAISAAVSALRDTQSEVGNSLDESTRERLKRLYGVLHEIVMRLQFAFGRKHHPSDSDETGATDAQRAEFYRRVKPLLEQIVSFSSEPRHGMLFASTAHHFMEFLQEAVKYDPRGALHLAAAVASAGERGGYHLDSMAAGETVKLAERFVADHRSELRAPEVLSDLVKLLDLFAKVGWPDALRLLWRLDEVFR